MESTVIDSHYIVSILISIVLAGVGWWVNGISKMMAEQQKAHNEMVLAFQKQISDQALKLASDYIPRQEMRETIDRLFKAIEDLRKDVMAREERP